MDTQLSQRWSRRRILKAAALAASVSAVLPLVAACSSSAPATTASPAATGPTATSAPAPAAPTAAATASTAANPTAAAATNPPASTVQFKGVTINVAIPTGAEEAPTAAVKAAYEQATGAKVNVSAIPTVQLQQKVSVELVAGTGAYDVVDVSPWWNGTMSPHLLPLDDFLHDAKLADPNFDLADFDPLVIKQYSTWNGKIVGFPAAADLMMLLYRTDLFNDPKEKDAFKAKYGRDLTLPKTYDDFDQVAEFFTRPEQGLFGTALMAKQSHQSAAMWQNRFLALGGQFFDDKMNSLINDDKGVQALTSYVKELKFAPTGSLTYESPEAIAAFLGGRTAMMEQWPGQPIVDGQNPDKSKVVGKFNAVAVPGGHACAGGWFFGVAKDSKNAQAAYKFVETRSNKQFVKLALLKGGRMPGRKSTYADPEVAAKFPSGYADAFYQAMVQSIQPPNTLPVDDELKTRLDDLVSGAVAGQQSPKAALDQAAQAWTDVLKKGGYLKG